jgi:hypothetical protein
MADTLQPTNRYVHFPAELIPSDHLAYISLSRTDTEMPQLALAYETLRDEDKRREYDLITLSSDKPQQTHQPHKDCVARLLLRRCSSQEQSADLTTCPPKPTETSKTQEWYRCKHETRLARWKKGPKSQSNAPEDSGRQEKRLVSPAMAVPARPAHQSATTKANGARSTAAHCVHNVSMSACTSSRARSVVPTHARDV